MLRGVFVLCPRIQVAKDDCGGKRIIKMGFDWLSLLGGGWYCQRATLIYRGGSGWGKKHKKSHQIMSKGFRKWTLFTSIGLFIISLTQTGYCTTNLCRSSIDCLITGALGFLYGGAAMTWLANPVLIASWALANRNLWLSLTGSILATIISLSFLLFHHVLDNEAGHLNTIISYKAGYWLWLASSLTMLAGNAIVWIKGQHEGTKRKRLPQREEYTNT